MILLAAAAPAATHSHALLTVAALLGIATVVVLITWLKVHPFLALILGSAVLGVVAGLGPSATVTSFTNGVGSTVGSVGILIALGAMIGGLLSDTGGAERIVGTVVDRVPGRALPWAMAGVAALVGIPLFFEVGVVLLAPIVLLAARRSGAPLMKVGIPALAGLSVLHGLVPPHPGPLVAIAALKADLGLTLLFGLIVAVPAVILAGPVYGSFISRHVHAQGRLELIREREPELVTAGGAGDRNRPGQPPRAGVGTADPDRQCHAAAHRRGATRRPTFGAIGATVLLPVVLMLLRAIAELTLDKGSAARQALDGVGNPVVALLAGVILALLALGVGKRAGSREAVGLARRVAAADRGDPADRRRRWRVQADAGRRRRREPGLRCGSGSKPVTVAPGLAGRCRHPARHRVGHRGDDHRGRDRHAAGRRPVPAGCSAAGVGGRLRFVVLLPRQRRRLLAREGVLRPQRHRDHQELVGDGDDYLRRRAARGAAHQRLRLSPTAQASRIAVPHRSERRE